MHKQIWYGMAEVKPLSGIDRLRGGKGAFVEVMAWADDAEHFRVVVERSSKQGGVELVNLIDAEPWASRSTRGDLTTDLLDMEEAVAENIAKVAFGTFHTWFKDDLTHQS